MKDSLRWYEGSTEEFEVCVRVSMNPCRSKYFRTGCIEMEPDEMCGDCDGGVPIGCHDCEVLYEVRAELTIPATMGDWGDEYRTLCCRRFEIDEYEKALKYYELLLKKFNI